jgi:hypothetical protein
MSISVCVLPSGKDTLQHAAAPVAPSLTAHGRRLLSVSNLIARRLNERGSRQGRGEERKSQPAHHLRAEMPATVEVITNKGPDSLLRVLRGLLTNATNADLAVAFVTEAGVGLILRLTVRGRPSRAGASNNGSVRARDRTGGLAVVAEGRGGYTRPPIRAGWPATTSSIPNSILSGEGTRCSPSQGPPISPRSGC